MAIGLVDLPGWFMQFYSIRDLFIQWENVGIFQFLLPFLLIFALIFGILSSTNILGGNKGINLVISFVIGLMALRLGFVQDFLTEVFPKLAVGLVAILLLLILVGLFIPDQERRFWTWGLGAIGFGIAVFIIFQTIDFLGWGRGGYWGDYAGWIFGAILIIGLIIAIGASGGNSGRKGGRRGGGRDESLGEALFSRWRD